MCRTVQCSTCGKTTWAGCGQHVNQVMESVPSTRRCICTEKERDAAKKQGSFLSRLFGG